MMLFLFSIFRQKISKNHAKLSYAMPLSELMVIEPDLDSEMKSYNPWSVSDASGLFKT